MIASAVPSFFLGTLLSLYASIDCQTTIVDGRGSRKGGSDAHLHLADVLVENRVQSRVADLERTLQDRVEAQVQLRLAEAADAGMVLMREGGGGGGGAESAGGKNQTLFPKQGFGMYLAGMATVTKDSFVKQIDPGVPLDESKDGNSDVLILYNSIGSIPNRHRADDSLNRNNRNPRLSMPEAVENCELLHVVLQHNTGGRKQCVAIVPQYESYHIQKWMRLPNNRKELALVSRGRVEKGMDRFRPPRHYETKQFWTWLHKYLSTMDDVLEELKPIVERVAVDNTVIVLVCNLGQSELLANFVCSSRARGFDLGRVLLFATDEETKELAEGLGITAFYDHRVRASSLVRIEASLTPAFTLVRIEASLTPAIASHSRCLSCFFHAELRFGAQKGRRHLRRRALHCHDVRQGHLRPAHFRAGVQLPLSGRGRRLVQGPRPVLQRTALQEKVRRDLPGRRRTLHPVLPVQRQQRLLLLVRQRPDAALLQLAAHVRVPHHLDALAPAGAHRAPE
jgi:hypothetical protein